MSTLSVCRFLACRTVANVPLGVPLVPCLSALCAVPCVAYGAVLSAPLCIALGVCLRWFCVPCVLAAVLCSGRCVCGWLCASLCGCALVRCVCMAGAGCVSLCVLLSAAPSRWYGRAVFVAVCGCEAVLCVP
ncbi:hypothetical protein SEA_GUUELAD_140 [Mycobacterium phage GuuelaD]|uniref:Uncharacterized protein n=1 Tax=Mycobacterium phage GuuelaD TaxID=2015819 RepID=A0A286MQN8_9CAUD|nr:hypothetical protein J4T97_gp101 [Mycobacterium phage GuuelaD]ASW31563.1 hypothetical protein SEA_GUUELAD_140 [Mycobacterium phage GuuelaD]